MRNRDDRRERCAAGRARAWRGAVVGALLTLLAGGPAAAVDPAAVDPKDRAVVGDAFRYADTADWERAFAPIERVDDPLPAKTLRWMRMVRNEGRESFADLARFLLANPHWPLPERLQFLAEGRITDPADHELIRRLFDARPPLTPRGHIRYAEALLRAGEDARARELLRRAWVEGDFSASEGRNFHDRFGHLLTEQDHIARLDNLLWDYRRSSASRMLDRVPEGHRRLAEARLRLQRRQPGVDAAIARVPGELRNDPGLIFDRLRWRRQKRRHDDTMEILLDPPAELGRPSMWWFEREFQLRRALRERDFDLAYRLASRHGQAEGEAFAEAEWLAGWLALRFAGQPRAALRRFERLYDGVTLPISLARAAYWAGRTAAELGDARGAEAWYRRAARHDITFYGQQAAAELGEPLLPLAPLPATRSQRIAFAGKELVRVARMLIEVGADEALRPFLVRLAKDATGPVEVRLAGELAAAAGRPDLMVATGKFAIYGGVVDEATAFPIPEIAGLLEARAEPPDPALVLGVARQESLFDTWVVSRAGARGLLQLMPRTAYVMARRLDLPYNRGLLTGDPEYNVRLGSAYLGGLLDRFDGETALALAAYNAGPGRVNRWLGLHGDPREGDGHELIDWIELIPFDETRNYVQRVMENDGVYRRRLEEPEPSVVAMRPVNGPLDPLPVPAARPADAVLLAAGQGPIDPPPTPDLKPPATAQVIPAGYRPPPLPRLKPDLQAGGTDRPEPVLKPREEAAAGGAPAWRTAAAELPARGRDGAS